MSKHPTHVPSASPFTRFEHAWRAMRHRNFRLFVAGQSISLIGTWMTRLATSWLVYRLMHSALLLGLVGFTGQILTFLIAPVAGVLGDRMDRRKLLIWTQVAAGAQSLTLAALTLSGRINIWEIIALSAVQGLINAFDIPVRQSFMVQMVEDRADLGNAIALNSSMVNLARLIGPAVAGFVIAVSSEGVCFLIDGISYIPVVISLAMMVMSGAPPRAANRPTMWTSLVEGWDYVRGFSPIRTILTVFAITSLFGFPFMVVLPIFASQVLHGGPNTLGLLTGASGMGALAAALLLAARKSVRGLTGVIMTSALLFGGALIGFGLSRQLWLSMAIMVIGGFGMMQGMAATNTVVQTLVPEDKRGRVMSYYTMAFTGMAPFGSLLIGGLAHWIGAQYAVMTMGAACMLGGLWYMAQLPKIRPVMLPIYREMGIYPLEKVFTVEQKT